ncbi:hypothetical protein H1R20_g1066, partial [Candolleomyces eurysporus]
MQADDTVTSLAPSQPAPSRPAPSQPAPSQIPLSATPSIPQPTFIPSNRTLKQPLAPAWSDARKAALDETQKLRSAKERSQEIERLNQKTVTLVIYYKVHKPPIILTHSVDTWPYLQLSSIPSLIKDLEITLDSYLEHYNNTLWTLIRISSPIVVARDQRVLLRVRKSLLEDLNDEDWPNIHEEMRQQGKSRQPGSYLKRIEEGADEEGNSGDCCQFCDEPLPAFPTPHLESLLSELKELPGYPDHLSFVTFIDYCARHRFETDEVPKAVSAGWPDHVNFFELAQRIKNIKVELEELLLDPEESQFFQSAVRGQKGKVKSGITTFQEQGCGYYGELGFQIFSMMLQQMFPSESVDLASVKPLSWNDMIDKFLVPEAAVLLIMEDMSLLWEDAVDVLHASRVYGNAAHPSNDEHPAVLAARPPIDIRVKEETLDDIGPNQLSDSHKVVIDLTLDDD